MAPLSGGRFTFPQLKGWCQQFRIITYSKKYLNFILHGSFFASLNENVSVIIGVHLKAGVWGEGGIWENRAWQELTKFLKEKKQKGRKKKHCGQVIEHVITS